MEKLFTSKLKMLFYYFFILELFNLFFQIDNCIIIIEKENSFLKIDNNQIKYFINNSKIYFNNDEFYFQIDYDRVQILQKYVNITFVKDIK